jgi:sensor histidine kinase YesM
MLNTARMIAETNAERVNCLTSIIANSTSISTVWPYSGCLFIISCDLCKESYEYEIQMDKLRRLIQKLSENRTIVHAGFILSSAVIIILGIKYYFGNFGTTTGSQGYISILYFFVCVYTGRWICKTWFLKNKLFQFSLFTLLGFVVLVYGGRLILNTLLHLNQKNIDEFFFAITPLFVFGMLTGIFVPMIRALLQKQVAEARIIAVQKEGELNLLQSQLSPHFLFNTLNNLYAISIAQHEKIPRLLLKLSELLRYSVYESRQRFIPLKEEVQYINNYISFEKIRIGERLNLRTDIQEIDSNEINIAPMLLIVYIENAFKHSKDSLDRTIFIDISLKIIDENITFLVTNSCNRSMATKRINKDGGLGLENVKKRLELLYTNEYILNEQLSENFYSVKLQLKAK